MSRIARIMLTLTILAFIVWALHFVPQLGLPQGVTDFAGGMGMGSLIATVVIRAGERTPPD